MRDGRIGWLGGLGTPRNATIREASAESEVLSLLKKQGEQLLKQQQQINQLFGNEREESGEDNGWGPSHDVSGMISMRLGPASVSGLPTAQAP